MNSRNPAYSDQQTDALPILPPTEDAHATL